MSEKNIIDAWGDLDITDYDHLFKQFGMKKFEDLDISNHHIFKRKLIIAHRDFDRIKDSIVNKKRFAQITGIASSGQMHFGHKLDVDFFMEFKKLGALSKFIVADIDAYLSRPDSKVPDMKKAKEVAVENVMDLLALGISKDDIFVQSRMCPEYFQLSFECSKKITENQFKGIYGHINPGKLGAVLLQLSDILFVQSDQVFGKCPTITGIGLEQDPHARAVRNVSKMINYDFTVPSFFYFTHQAGLKEGKKMSASTPDTAILLSDSDKDVKKKINRAFTGGRETAEEQREIGGNSAVCKVYEMQKFHNPSDAELSEIDAKCKSGEMLCGECKKKCIDYLHGFLGEHRTKRESFKSDAEKMVYGK